MAEKLIASESAKRQKYVAPEMERHQPVKLVQTSYEDCVSLYYTTLYYGYYH